MNISIYPFVERLWFQLIEVSSCSKVAVERFKAAEKTHGAHFKIELSLSLQLESGIATLSI